MVDENYNKILERVSKVSDVSKEELERMVEAKRAKLAGLITHEGAAQIVAAELGVSFENETLKIDELLPGMRKVNTLGKIIRLFPVRSFSKNGREGKVCNFVLADDTSNVKIVLWDVNHIALIEKGEIKEGDSVEINNASMRDGEIHLGSFSDFKKSSETFENVITAKVIKEKKISEMRLNDNVKTRAFVVQTFDPRFFYVCPECKKKANPEGEDYFCGEHGKVAPEKRALINLVLDDGTETIRAVFFHEQLKQLGLNELENPSLLAEQRTNLLGKELVFIGNVRNNAYFNNPEFIAEQVLEVDLDGLIKEHESQ